MRKKRKSHVIRYSLLAILALLLAIWITGPFREGNEEKRNQEEEKSLQQDANKSVRNESKTENDDSTTVGDEKESNEGTALDEKIVSVINDMTLEEKIGQLMVVGFPSKEADEHIKRMIEDYHVGGVILYDRNMESPQQVARLTNELQDLAAKSSNSIPLMISIDQEGGAIVRMRDRVTPIPSQQELAKREDEQEIYTTAKRTGQELSAMGIQVNFAPDLDLSTTDTRSFGIDPENAYRFGKQVVKGLSDTGVAATLKHFPGNGRSGVDPHHDTSSVEANKGDLENNDIYPFKKLIENVDHQQFFVMVTHIKYPAYDSEKPASISPVIIQDLLREQLGYKGIVVTDDLEMGAVSKYFTYQDLGYEAVKAGADLLLVCHTLENQDQVYKGILNAVQSGELDETKIDEAVERILQYKYRSIDQTYADPNTAEQLVGK